MKAGSLGDMVEFTATVRQQAMESLHHRLSERQSPLAGNPETIDQLRRQVSSVLDDVADASGLSTEPDPPTVNLSEEIGTARAVRGVHPVESVRTAVEMFQVLLPVVLNELRAQGLGDAAVVSTVGRLHGSIMRRLGLGAVSYASHLLKKVNESHRDERQRIARELHDRAAHAIGVALQDLELHEIFERDDPARARARLAAARAAMHEAITAVRQTAQELRDSTIEHGGLEQALSSYVTAHVPAQVAVVCTVTGDLRALPVEVCDELYIVLREAIRNAVLHSAASNVEVSVDIQDGSATATVRDDGTGFDATAEMVSPSGIGLLSIRERVELLDGDLAITSVDGAGTTVTIVISWAGSAA